MNERMNVSVIDGTKAGVFDGLMLEISGLSGSASSKRIAVNTLEKMAVMEAKGEVMLMVKTAKGGFGLAISANKKKEWEDFVQIILDAKKRLQELPPHPSAS